MLVGCDLSRSGCVYWQTDEVHIPGGDPSRGVQVMLCKRPWRCRQDQPDLERLLRRHFVANPSGIMHYSTDVVTLLSCSMPPQSCEWLHLALVDDVSPEHAGADRGIVCNAAHLVVWKKCAPACE